MDTMLWIPTMATVNGEIVPSRVYLTTGPRQPEAVALYLSTGYTALYDRSLPSEQVGVHAFEKLL